MSSTDMNPFDETGTENLDMEDPPADTALAQQDLADSGSDHPAEATDSAQVSQQHPQRRANVGSTYRAKRTR